MAHAQNPDRTEVLIVGAGPTGLTLACDLARRGVSALLVERAPALFPGSRGKGLQPRTLEVFEDLGLLDAVHAAGRPYPRMMNWENGERQGEWDLVERAEPDPTVPFPAGWMLPQWRTQELLYERLRELGGEVAFGTALSGLDQHPDRVEARLTGPDGTGRTVAARYLVAADGGRSTVRRAVGIPMTGEQVDPRPALVADVEIDGLDRENWHCWPKGPGGALLLCPLPSTTAFQLFAQFGADGGPETGGDPGEPDTSARGVRRTIAARTHLPESAVGAVHWASGFRPRAALADRFREGRVFLAGDAAQSTPRPAARASTPASRTRTTSAGSSARCCGTAPTRHCWTATSRSGCRSPPTCWRSPPGCTARAGSGPARCGAARAPSSSGSATRTAR
ncbi:hypothetical protein GCM10009639_34200 [Kitasatospora putterlickiae]|uniref:FAD-binding domain-containing protein n=1 Tax=Kitasatospora putterlickiae TaxID=221725 RepID=A0ABP4IRR6_9ACTN